MEEALGEANQILKQAGKVEKSLTKVNEKGLELEVEVDRLKIEVSKAQSIGITKFKESKAYKSNLTETVTLFLTMKKIKMERLL